MIARTQSWPYVTPMRTVHHAPRLGLVASLLTALACGGSDALLGNGDSGPSEAGQTDGRGAGGPVGDAGTTGVDAGPRAGQSGQGDANDEGTGDASEAGDSSTTGCAGPLTFADPDLDTIVRQAIGLPSGPIHAADVAGVTDLDTLSAIPAFIGPPCPADGGDSPIIPCIDYAGPPQADGWITSLVGIECIPSLRSFAVDPFLLDMSPLAGLPNLTTLWFGPTSESSFPRMPQVTTLSAAVGDATSTTAILSALPSLTSLELRSGQVTTDEARAALSALTGLTTLSAANTGIDAVPLGPLSHLTDAELSGNYIRDLSPLTALAALRSLDLSNNVITDLAPLVANLGLGLGGAVAVTGNPLDCAAQQENIATLRARGVTVITDCP